MRVQIVDPPAYTPPYDRSLCAALARAGADVELVTSPFSWGSVPDPEGYAVDEPFYSRSARLAPGRGRRPLRAMEHVADMLRYRGQATERADVVHFQRLAVPRIDHLLLPKGMPLVQTPHGLLRASAWERGSGRAFARLLRRMDAVVALSEYGAGVVRERAAVEAERVRVIPHGPLDYLTRLDREAPLPGELARAEGPVVLFFGLVRPYKGVDVLIDAFAELSDAELWVVGRPFGVDLGELRDRAAASGAEVRFVPRFVPDEEIPAIFRRADVVALPHREAEQSGVLATALAFAKPMVMSDVGGFPEVAGAGAGRLFEAGDATALASALGEVLGNEGERQRLSTGAAALAAGDYSWERIAKLTLDLYRSL